MNNILKKVYATRGLWPRGWVNFLLIIINDLFFAFLGTISHGQSIITKCYFNKSTICLNRAINIALIKQILDFFTAIQPVALMISY